MTVRACVLVPTYDNPGTLREVVEKARRHLPDVLVVDDGSHDAGRAAAAALAREGLAEVVHRASNGGKGAAVKTGLAAAHERGFTHALQVDADGQHAIEDAEQLLAAARAHPDALVLAAPIFDASAPRGRRWGREVTRFWTRLETLSRAVADPMCGFRVYPVGVALAARARGDRMDFDPEVVVRMTWLGVPVINVPTRVRYLSPQEGGVSHFRLFRDNVAISTMHMRLFFGMLGRLLTGRLRRATLA